LRDPPDRRWCPIDDGVGFTGGLAMYATVAIAELNSVVQHELLHNSLSPVSDVNAVDGDPYQVTRLMFTREVCISVLLAHTCFLESAL
jgi:hypothetical protein